MDGHLVDALTQPGRAPESHVGRDLSRQARRRTLLRVIREHAGGGQPGLADEDERMLELLLRLAGEAGDEGGTYGDARKSGADARQEAEVRAAVATASHAP